MANTRQQPGYSCEECRKRKARCDRARPSCGACAEAGTTCVVPQNRPARGPKKGQLNALRSRIGEYMAEINKDYTTGVQSKLSLTRKLLAATLESQLGSQLAYTEFEGASADTDSAVLAMFGEMAVPGPQSVDTDRTTGSAHGFEGEKEMAIDTQTLCGEYEEIRERSEELPHQEFGGGYGERRERFEEPSHPLHGPSATSLAGISASAGLSGGTDTALHNGGMSSLGFMEVVSSSTHDDLSFHNLSITDHMHADLYRTSATMPTPLL
jgi:hypothetical protein